MKNFIDKLIPIMFATIVVFFVACQPSDEKVNDNRQINNELLKTQKNLKQEIREQTLLVSELKENATSLNKIMSIDSPRYVLTLQLKQSHTSLNIGKHIKDDMNKIEFQMPVDQIFYDKVKKGDNLVDEFRSGSFFTEGSFGSWKMKVIKKEIK